MIGRRRFVAGLGACALLPAVGSTPSRAATSLKDAAASTGRFFGAAIRLEDVRTQPDLAAVLLRECSSVTPELALKWAAMEPAEDTLSFTLMDDLVDFASHHGLDVYGHTLLWHASLPEWTAERLRERADWNLVRRHFASVIPRYGDGIRRWDVVNEPIETGYREDGMRRGAFLDAFGPTYVDRALHDARMFAPAARLYVNEYGLDLDVPEDRARRHLLLGLIERLKTSGVPLDGIGIQGHLDLRKGPFDEMVFSRFLDDLASFGLEIVVTELDVNEAAYQAPAVERDRRVAEIVRRYLDVALSKTAVLGVTTWGLSDRHSWLTTPDEAIPTDGGAGPGLNRGLPYDSDMREKPMRDAILGALLSATPRG